MFRHTLAAVVLGAVIVASPASQAQQIEPEALARYPNGAFLENMLAEEDGSVLFTSYFARSVMQWSPTAGTRAFKAVEAFPVSMARHGAGYLVAAHTTTFDKLATTPGANRILHLSASGEVIRETVLADARFLNGIEPIGGDQFLIADAIAGLVWRYDAASGRAVIWLQNEALAKIAGSRAPTPGVNGVRRSADGFIYLSNSERRSLMRIRLGADGSPVGDLETIATGLPGIDDFAVERDGSVIIATHRNEVLRRGVDGGLVTLVAGEASAGVTSVVRGKGPSAAFVFGTGTGGLFEGGKGEAVFFRFRLP